jgi:hypothetical protein
MRAGGKIVTTDSSDATGRGVERQSDGSAFHAQFLLDELGTHQKAEKYQDQNKTRADDEVCPCQGFRSSVTLALQQLQYALRG